MKWFKSKFLVFVFLFFVVAPVVAFAQAAAPTFDPASSFGQLLSAVQGRHWGIVAGVVLSAAIYALRQWIIPSKWAWARTDRGGLIVAYGVSVLATVAASLASGTTSPWTILDSVGALVFSTGTFNVIRSAKSKA